MRYGPVLRTILLISLVNRDEGKLRQLAMQLRCMPGVRQIDVAIMPPRTGWRSEPEIPPPFVRRDGKEMPWQPYGVMLHVESSGGDDDLRRKVDAIWQTAISIERDPELMELNSADMW